MIQFKKVMASVLAAATVATSMAAVVSIPTEALYFDKNSKFAYDLSVDGDLNNVVKVTFYTTYNPGVTNFSVALDYDATRLTYQKTVVDVGFGLSSLYQTASNATEGLLIFAAGSNTNSDYTAPISVSYYFVPKSTSSKNTYDFSACVFSYNSQTEGIDFGNSVSADNFPEEVTKTVSGKGTYTRAIGDVKPNGAIEINDASEILGIVATINACVDTSEYVSYATVASNTTFLNNLMSADASYTLTNGNSNTWRNRLKSTLYANDVPFAEVADCDQNNVIEKKDAELVLEYYAKVSAAQDPDSVINSKLSKVVYAEITT